MTILASDNFTRANNADLGTAWDECTGDTDVNGFDISANTAIPAAGSDTSETNNSVTWPDDQYAEVTHFNPTADGAGAGSGPMCRASAAGANTRYRLVGNASGYGMERVVAGAFTILRNSTGTTFAAGDKMRLEVRTSGANCIWTLKKNGVQFDTDTDTSPIASGSAGIAFSSTSTTAAVSAWEGGTLDDATGGIRINPLFADQEDEGRFNELDTRNWW